MQSKKSLITLAFLFGFVGVSYADNSTDAIEFMITGDMGFEKGGLEQVSFKDCVLAYSQNAYGNMISITHDFNKAKWKSASFTGENFEVACSGKCTTAQSEKDNTISRMITMAISPNSVAFPVITTKDRFTTALYDFQEQCKGSTSKY